MNEKLFPGAPGVSAVKFRVAGLVASCPHLIHTIFMLSWADFWRRFWPRPKATPQPPSHVGGRGIPNILGVCEDCGAVVVEGLHHPTPAGYLCQRCATSKRHPQP
jgi:hypothetical protein